MGAYIIDTINDNATDAENLKIQQDNLKIQKEGAYNSANSTLTDYNNQLTKLDSTLIPDANESIRVLQENLGNWDKNYAAEVGSAQLEIDTYDDYLNNWQKGYDQQTAAAKSQGRDTLTSLLSNWSDAEVAAADRGMGGSMNLIANQQKQKAIEYAGSDLSIEGSDGLFGMEFMNMTLGLDTAKRQAQDTRGILGIGIDNLKTSFANQKTGWETQLEIDKNALDTYTKSKDTLTGNITEQQATVDRLKREAGL